MTAWRVGMSGFSFASWVGDFYPAGTKPAGMLAHYAARFDAVELNTTYYRTPKPEAVAAWRRAAPGGFRFSVKAVRWLSYNLEPGALAAATDRFVETVSGLGAALGVVYIQGPRGARFDPARLRRMLDALPQGPAYVFEPRHESFRDPAALEMLRGRGVGWAMSDEGADVASLPLTSPTAYVRMRRGSYADGELEAAARALRALAARDVYVFFRHEASPGCVAQALAFRELLVGGPRQGAR